MEIFVDGGLFELITAVLFGYAINFIFRRKLLLIGYSVFVLLAPVALLFIKRGELFYFLSFISISSSVVLILLLWKQKTEFTGQKNLFNVDKYKKMVLHRFHKTGAADIK